MNDQTVDIQHHAATALKQLAATDINAAVRTQQLAKRIRLLGVREALSKIAQTLTELAPTPWGARFAIFVGGSNDPFDQYIWTLPKE